MPPFFIQKKRRTKYIIAHEYNLNCMCNCVAILKTIKNCSGIQLIRSQLGQFINRFRKENWAELLIRPKPSCYEGSVHRFNGSEPELSLQKIELHIF